MTKEEALAMRRKLFEAFDSVLEALDAGDNGSCSSYEKDPFEDMNNKLKERGCVKHCEDKWKGNLPDEA